MDNNLKSFLEAFGVLTDYDIQACDKYLKKRTLKRGEFFIKEGAVSNEVAFVVSGMFRSYYYNSKEEEVTYCFTFQNTFVSAYSSFLTQTATNENIEALTDVVMFSISKDALEQLEELSINWLKVLKILSESEYIKMEKRIFLLQNESAEKKYEDLLINHPEFIQSIPLNYLSSYLGITPRHLSRIRARLSN